MRHHEPSVVTSDGTQLDYYVCEHAAQHRALITRRRFWWFFARRNVLLDDNAENTFRRVESGAWMERQVRHRGSRFPRDEES
jgi:hypothetical protein